MPSAKPTLEQKRLDADIWIIVAVTLAVLGVFFAVQNQMTGFVKDSNQPVLLRTLLAAAFQFGIAGLGVTIVAAFRKESFLAYGLRAKGTLKSIALCVLCFVPYIVFAVATGLAKSYLPLQSVWTTRDVLAAGFPENTAGMLLIAAAWGFFEGFNYVAISGKINKRYPSKYKWLNWGAIVCAVLCILIHGMIGVTFAGVIEMITVLVIIYGMLMVKEFTGNAWGCVFIFVFLWNAF